MALFVINTISATKFSINGREMFKTFTPVYLNDTKISVTNIYDSVQYLFRNTNVSDIELNGIVYANSTLLITALVPVIFIPAGEGTFSQAQIDQNTANILILQNEKADINHNHNSLYYLKTEIDTIIANLPTGTAIVSGAVIGQKLVFYDNLENVVFEIDVKKFFEQASNLTYNDGILQLENVFGTILSNINLNFLPSSTSSSIPQSFTYAGGSQVFTLSYAPNNVDVYVNHVWQIPTIDATLSGADVTVVPELTIGDVVTVRPFGAANLPEQFTATEGQTDFNLSVTPNNVDVHYNSVWQIPILDYTITGNLLTLSEPATAGDIITVRPF
jgi:hypothetical protein